MTKKMYKEMVAEVRAEVEAMKVTEMRKAAAANGIKNASQFKRPELTEKLIEKLAEIKKAAIEADEAAKKAATKKPATKKADKRYKATKVAADDVEVLANEIINATPEELQVMDLFSVNRKVLIEVMKRLHCELWYRTYDKPTMVAKINAAVAA